MTVGHHDRNILHGISVSFTKRKIQKYRRKLGNGRDAELHLTVADLYKHLGEESLALESYHAAATTLLQEQIPLTVSKSDQLIKIYKRILAVDPLNEHAINSLGREYQRRGFDYRAVEIHASSAERYAQRGEYQKAIAQYQKVVAIEPGSITMRVTCASLYCQLGNHKQAAREYAYIGDIHFEHKKFDGALEYYQQASTLDPEDEMVQQKYEMTRQILDGALIPQAQASLQKLNILNSQKNSHLQRSLAEKEQIERELRNNIQLLKQRYQQSVKSKNEQLCSSRKRLEELSTYVAVFKDNLEQIALEKQNLQEQLERELRYKHNLEQKLSKLGTGGMGDSQEHADDPVLLNSEAQPEQTKRLDSAVIRLNHGKVRLERRLQKKLEQSSERENQLRQHLEQQISRGASLKEKLTRIHDERKQVEQKLQQQLQKSLQREHLLREQMQQLIGQHEDALKQVEHEKQIFEKKYRTTQEQMNIVETHTMTTLEQLHGELSRQCEMESNFFEQFHTSLQEITMLLNDQEQEIQKLEQL
jgi:tetratricopeptide (TPR) repeat protein